MRMIKSKKLRRIGQPRVGRTQEIHSIFGQDSSEERILWRMQWGKNVKNAVLHPTDGDEISSCKCHSLQHDVLC